MSESATPLGFPLFTYVMDGPDGPQPGFINNEETKAILVPLWQSQELAAHFVVANGLLEKTSALEIRDHEELFRYLSRVERINIDTVVFDPRPVEKQSLHCMSIKVILDAIRPVS